MYLLFNLLQIYFRKTIRIHNEIVADPTAVVANRYSTFNMPVDVSIANCIDVVANRYSPLNMQLSVDL
jgi:hypothetical protein